jgi:predicted nucleotide-binding protein
VATLFVPREQVAGVLAERIRAGEELLANAEIAKAAYGYRDWIYLFARWREHTIAELKAVYDGDDMRLEFDAGTTYGKYSSPEYAFPFAKSSLELGLWILRTFVERLPLAVEPEPLHARAVTVDHTRRERSASAAANVFIVHGRAAGGFRDSVALFVKELGLHPVILAEQANEGRTLIEKFEAHALDVGYAIVLLTPEDSAYGPDEEPPPSPNRARQNVILELGYFMARLGRKNVVALRQEGLELPTDILGVAYIPLDDGQAWKTLLARELQHAGIGIGPTTVPG